MDLKRSTNLTKFWLRNCFNNHTSCKFAFSGTSQEPFALPRRVIDVGSGDGISKPFLFESDAQRGSYVALSHCWGGSASIVTTRSSIEAMKKSIPIADMSRTLQDAVSITREIGFQYLWVDYLCIVQDDVADWECQSSQIGAIYNHATLTIAATAARNGTQGCLIPRDKPSLDPVCIPIANGQDQVFMMPTVAACESGLDTAEIRPLDTRAWTLQENILSLRTVSFERREITWECNESRQSESRFSNDGGPDGYPSSKKMFRSSLNASHPQSIHATWCTLVESYSKRNLTFSKDKLPAICGLAQIYPNHLGARYFAGMWSTHLLEGLLWTCVLARVPTGYRAPSWSWASVDGPIRTNWHWSTLEPWVRVLDVSVELLRDDMFGELRSAHLLLLGKIKDAKCNCQQHSAPDSDSKGECRYYEYRPPSPGIDEGGTGAYLDADGKIYFMRKAPNETETPCPLKFRLQKDGERASFDSVCDVDGLKLCLIGYYSKIDPVPVKWMESLLLRPVAGSENTFERIGRWKSFEHLDFYQGCLNTTFTLV